MFPIIVEAESILIREGDSGAEMYIIEYGEFEVSVNGQLTNKLLPGAVFGELALLHEIPRTATVKAISKSKVWSAEQTSFSCIRIRDQIYRKAVAKEVIQNFLTSVKTFLSTESIDKLVSLSQNRYIKAGTFVKLDDREMIILLKEALIEDETRRKVFPKDILNKDFHSISDVELHIHQFRGYLEVGLGCSFTYLNFDTVVFSLRMSL
ncbi:cGMP-dependent protein kinase 1-like [Cephus cinctus]|uniref:cGMP-dependent protein kinase 1-like n=1 Tax=Cephus cinctus TaxID=211228 RepID=A0AAJ7W1X8_CEPCN|nr:cGMP-dependent protein kinase 1-like [Cephus cinctus]